MTTNTPIVIYHSPCTDGFTAAWACRKAHPDWQYYPQSHGAPFDFNRVADRDVYLLDFAFPLQDMITLAHFAKKIVILDHHKTAAEALAGFTDMLKGYPAVCRDIEVIFDMERSGAKLSWDYFHKGRPAPELILHVQDRDLWQFKLEGTKEVHAALSSYDHTFESWDLIERQHPSVIVADGMAILRKHNKEVRDLINTGTRYMNIGGVVVPAVNAPHEYASDIGHVLAEGAPYAAVFWDGKRGRQWSLRSREGGTDVSAVAKTFGGGGHKHAAGFQSEHDWFGDVTNG
jgi:oligoribonuclease NrnB/cAMP/cGMP phosphodiesterase (DHH superfamily)